MSKTVENNLIIEIIQAREAVAMEDRHTRDSSSEHVFRTIFDHNSTAMAVIDKDFKISAVNMEFSKLLGYNRKEVEDRRVITELVNGNDLGRFKQFHNLIWSDSSGPGAKQGIGEYQFITKQGDRKTLLVTVAAIADANKSLVSLVDIAEDGRQEGGQKETTGAIFCNRIEERMREQFFKVFSYSPSMIGISRIEDGKYIDVNESLCRCFGLQRQEAIGRTGAELKFWADPSDRDRVVNDLLLGKEVNNLEIGYHIKSGEIRQGLFSSRIIELGGEKCFLFVLNDITERKQVENALRKSEQEYRTIFETTGTATVIIEEEMTISLANTEFEQLSGYSKEEIEGRMSWSDFFVQAELERTIRYHRLRRIDPNAAPRQYETGFSDRSGLVKNILVTIAMIPGTKQSVASFLDISGLRQAEQALRQSEEKFRTLFEMAPIGIDISRQGKNLLANQAYLKMHGYDDLSEIVGSSVLNKIAPEFRIQAAEAIKEREEGRIPPGAYEIVAQRKDGSLFPCYLESAGVELSDGPALIGFFIDISERKQAEEALRESEEQLRQITDNTLDLITKTDARGIIQYASPSNEHVLGYKPEDMVGKSAFDYVHPGDLTLLMSAFQAGIENSSEGRQEFRLRRSDGQYLWLETMGKVLLDDRGTVSSAIFGSRDITKRKQAENALQKERDFTSAVLDTTGALVVVLGLDGCIIRFNRTCESVTGYAFEDVQGQNFLDLLIIPEERERVKFVFESLCNGKYPNDGENFWLTKKGDRRLITWKNAVLLNEAFSVEYVIATGLDITEHRQAERTLYQSEERLRTLFENAPVGIAIFCNGRVVLANQAFHFMFDLKDDAQLRKSGIDYIAPDCRQEIVDRMRRREQGQAVPKLLETVGLKDDGTSFPVYIEFAQLDLPDIPASVAFISDITDRKLAEEKLRESYARLEKTLQQAVQSLSSITEMRDPYTAGHQVRVANLASEIAYEMGMPEGQVHAIRTAALIHDIGKIVIPAEILSKPGILNDLKRSFVQAHAQASYDIVKTIEFSWPIAESVLQHHERLDGTGYPRGVSGCNILKEARVLAVADVIETMASHRPYRPAFSLEEALDEIRQNAGVLYDPEVVNACLRLFLEKGFRLSGEI